MIEEYNVGGKTMKKALAVLGLFTVIFCGGVQAEAAPGFFQDVPLSDWSYEAVNGLITTGHVNDYTEPIPQGRIMSRMEMALIVDDAMQNLKAFTPAEQDTIQKLNKEYYYDIKKIQMLSKLDNADLEKAANEGNGTTFTEEEKAGLKKAAAFADKFSIDGYARLRNDHYLKDTGKTTRANMVHVQVNTTYKVNDNWQIHADLGYRNSFSGFDETKSLSPSENQTGTTMDTYVTGRMADNALGLKVGKWNEWNIYGWGMDIDCDFSGVQLDYGKKDFKTYFTAGKMDLWDNAMGGDHEYEQVTSLRFFYPFDKKNDINFGVSWSSAMASRYQDPDQGRVFYYYTHGHHKFDRNWDLRAGVINSNAKRDDTATASTKTKQPGRWLQLQYKGADLQAPGSYGITATYRYEPALSWPTVTDWCGLNERFVRLGVSWVPAKDILLDTFYTWAREIDTGAKDDMYRFQAQFFF
jgi:hypothetical protein